MDIVALSSERVGASAAPKPTALKTELNTFQLGPWNNSTEPVKRRPERE